MVYVSSRAKGSARRRTNAQREHHTLLVGLLVALSLLFILPALVKTAHAGTYSAAYSGGTITAGTGPSTSYSLGTDGKYGGAPYAVRQCGATGKITTVFTWTPSYTGEKPPKVVVVEEFCAVTASATAGGYAPSAYASANNGLGHPPVDVPNNNSSSYQAYSQTSSGRRYKVEHPDTDGKVIIDCTPSASASASSMYGNAYSSLSVKYQASLHPVSIEFEGTTEDGDVHKVLTGQRVTANLAGCPLEIKTPNSGVWFVGGAVFKDYTPYSIPCQVIPLTTADKSMVDGTASAVSFFTKITETVTVTFSGDLVIPTGDLPQPVLHLTVQEELTSLKPTATWQASGGTYVEQRSQANGGTLNSDFFAANQVFYPVTTTVPAPFSGGEVCFAQVVTPNRTNTRDPINGKPAVYTLKIPERDFSGNPTGAWVEPGTGHDGVFPYDKGRTNTGAIEPPIKTPPVTWNVGEDLIGGDSPKQLFKILDKDDGGTAWKESTASDSFDTWLMYRPPSKDGKPVNWIPLMKLHWSWSGSFTKDAGVSPEHWSQSILAFTTQSMGTPVNDHPTWSLRIEGPEYRP